MAAIAAGCNHVAGDHEVRWNEPSKFGDRFLVFYQIVILVVSILGLAWIVVPLFEGTFHWLSLELLGYEMLTGLILLMSLFAWVAGGEKWKAWSALLIHAAGYLKFMLLPHLVNMY